jgi:ketosteroid isomerase-like protein
MIAHSRTLPALVGLAWLAACAPAPPDFTEADQAEIRATTEAALAIANGSADWGEYTEIYYSADALFMPPNSEAVRGREAIAGFMAGFPPLEDFQLNPAEVAGSGDIAYVRGNYVLVMRPPGSEAAVTDRGKYVEIWRRQADGAWRLAIDIFNSDVPLPKG